MKLFVLNITRIRWQLLIVSILFPLSSIVAQVSIDGSTCAITNTSYTYKINPWSTSGSETWDITGGNVTGQAGVTEVSGNPYPQVLVTWTTLSGSGTLTLHSSFGNPPRLTVGVVPPLSGGPITTNQWQSINYNTVPATISSNPANGGYCTPSYSYQWQSSTDDINFTNLGITTQNLSFSAPLTQTTYFRRMVTETNTNTTAYSTNIAQIVVYPQVVSGSISPSSSTINYNTSPGQLSLTGNTGGNGTYTYQWQSSPNNTTWTNISGATAKNYTPGNLLVKTYYRTGVTSNGVTVYASSVVINVNPQLISGTVTPSTKSINYNTSPGTLTAGAATGGNGTYTYQWQSSPNNSTWTNISGATSLTYSPPSLTSTTYYHIVSTSNGSSVTSNSATVTVYPQLISGSVSPSNTTINYNTSPGAVSLSGTTGGNGTYTYQWQSSPNNTTWTNVSGATTNSYTPGSLTATIYYRNAVTSNAVTVYSNSATIHVNPNLISGTVTPVLTSISYNTSPGILTATAATGGNGTYSYQWESSSDNYFWTTITGATSLTYSPPALTTTTYYHLITTSNSLTVNSNFATVNVYSTLQAGSIPSTATLDYVGSITLIDTNYSGGDGNYLFQWQSSSDNSTWHGIGGATSSSFSVVNQVAKYYRLKITSLGVTQYTNSAYVYLPLYGGIIGSSVATVNRGGNATLTSLQNAANGECSNYTYQWQKSDDQINWTNISSVNQTNIVNTKYYRRLAICGSDTTSSNTVRIKVQPTIATIKPNTVTSAPAGSETIVAMPSDYSSIDPNNVNYIKTRDFTRPGVLDMTTANAETDVTDVRQVSGYFDGLGRPIETVAKQATPGLHDLISLNFYDVFGRQAQTYLPYTDNGNSGNFRIDPDSKQPAFFNSYFNNSEAYYYTNTTYESSPLNRVVKTTAPGNSWTGQDDGTSQILRTNDVYDSVITWNISFGNDTLPYTNGYYNPGTLIVTEATDEQDNQVIEYKDKEGHVVLKKVEISDSLNAGHPGWLCTYYVYDDLGNLRTVISPLAVIQLQTLNWAFESATLSNSTIAEELCFHYQYDENKRMTTKVVPGAGEVWMVYDARDRLVMTQDSAMRVQSNWLCTDFDSLNRPVSTGMWNTSGDRGYHQNLAASSVTYPSPSSGYTLLTQTYYDDYSWVSGSGSGLSSNLITTYNSNTSYFYTASNTTYPYPQAITATVQTQGMVTGTKVNVIGTSAFLYTVSFYDNSTRLIEAQTTNYSGGKDTIITQYSFAGQALRNLYCHAKAGTNPQAYKVLSKMFYDASGRVTAITKKIGNSLEDTIASNAYDELGQLSLKKLGLSRNSVADYTYTNQPIDTVRYSYNIRRWIRGINKDYARGDNNAVNWFGEELCYDFGFTAKQFNGNIAGIRWKNGSDNQARAYGFDYDNVNRLTEADFTQYVSGSTWNVSAGIDYSLHSVSYDQNGNILALNQMGAKLSGSVLIDSLIYNYKTKSNKLNYVTDNVNDTSAHLGDFTEINNATTWDYLYDGNGNLTKDRNKNIGPITYNYLNLPNTVTVTGEGTITYTYDAAGNKLQKQTVEGTKTTTTLYLGAFNYINDTLQYVMHEEGRARQSSVNGVDTFYYDFFEKDHLGNVRTVLTDQRQQDVYPKLTFEGTSSSQSVINQNATWDNSSGQNLDVVNIRANRPAAMGDTTTNGTKVMLVKKSTGSIGATKMLKVMAGDQLSVSVDYYYTVTNSTSSNSNGLNAFINSIASAILGSTATSAVMKNGSSVIVSNQNLDANVAGFFSPESGSSSGTNNPPKAYLHVLLFDERFVFDQTDSYVQQVGYFPGQVKTIVKALMSVKKSGYAYIYFSNESDDNVYFDNFNLTHTRGPLLEATDYYPFGLSMSGISSTALNFGGSENEMLYNGKEKQNKEFSDGSGIEAYDYGARMQDPQLGRWWSVDPLCEKTPSYSPYIYVANNPIALIDPDGRTFSGDTKKIDDLLRLGGSIKTAELAKQARIEKRIEKREEKGKSTDKLQRNLAESKAIVGEIDNMTQEISAMNTSSVDYNINSNFSKPNEGETVAIDENHVQISFGTNYGLAGLAHELKHGFQFETGEMDFSQISCGPGLLYDITDEIATYRRQFAISGSSTGATSIFDINETFVRNVKATDKNGISVFYYKYLPSFSMNTNSNMHFIYFTYFFDGRGSGVNPMDARKYKDAKLEQLYISH